MKFTNWGRSDTANKTLDIGPQVCYKPLQTSNDGRFDTRIHRSSDARPTGLRGRRALVSVLSLRLAI